MSDETDAGREARQDRQQEAEGRGAYFLTRWATRQAGGWEDHDLADARMWLSALDPTRYAFDDLAPKAEPVPHPTPDGVVRGIDVSSNNGMDIRALLARYDPSHVVVKCPSKYERAGLDAFSIAQAGTARELGKTTAGYAWLWRSYSARQVALESLDVADRAGITLTRSGPVFWGDLEIYNSNGFFDPGPTADQIQEWCETVEGQGVRAGLYTGRWWIVGYLPGGLAAYARFKDVYQWLALYDGVPDIEVWTPFSGIAHLTAKQWRVDNRVMDLDVFRAAAVAA